MCYWGSGMAGQGGRFLLSMYITKKQKLKIELSACIGMLETTEIHFNRKPMYKIECHFIVHDSSDS